MFVFVNIRVLSVMWMGVVRLVWCKILELLWILACVWLGTMKTIASFARNVCICAGNVQDLMGNAVLVK